MDISFSHLAVVSLVLLLMVVGARIWGGVLLRWWHSIPVIAYEPRRPVPWTVTEIALILAGYFFFQVAAVTVVFGLLGMPLDRPADEQADLKETAQSHEDTDSKNETEAKTSAPRKPMDARRYIAMLLAAVLASVLAAAATLSLLHSHVEPRQPASLRGRLLEGLPLRSSATWSDLGLPRPTLNDLKLGLLAFVAALLPISALQAILIQFTEKRHPIVEMLQQQMNPALLAVSALAAIVVAPFVEELLFRVVLQGWLERVQMLASSDAIAPSQMDAESGAAFEPRTRTADRLMPWPIVLSSLFFALAHLGHGFDPIPLFFLALVLGYLYQRTHRLWPSLVVHVALNTCSLSVLFLETIAK